MQTYPNCIESKTEFHDKYFVYDYKCLNPSFTSLVALLKLYLLTNFTQNVKQKTDTNLGGDLLRITFHNLSHALLKLCITFRDVSQIFLSLLRDVFSKHLSA